MMGNKDPQGVTLFAMLALNGMLAHATRYHQREEDAGIHWHEAIAREAFDIGVEMAREAASRGLADYPTPAQSADR